MKWKLRLSLISLLLLTLLTGCSDKTTETALQDGYYTAQAAEFSHGWKEYITIMVKGGIYAQEQVLQYQKEESQAAKDALIAAGLVVDQLEDEDEWKKPPWKRSMQSMRRCRFAGWRGRGIQDRRGRKYPPL